ncbi:hypothetical protein [Pseudothermotoga thermarum]|uniref:Uncharacterized protein n=1 Tax=Pseudothermotoga thermarum DSM 5069 TaxID=688269 RepID=F7YYV9_9THEM|nr:hypothetical protein [Pseudothermotoga thermarum]AEH51152.1 hypothetical protein Theth_1072 [Pseudothermotoga thermarum DSM 5069]
MRLIVVVFFTLFSIVSFSALVLVNLYDETGYLVLDKDFPIVFKASLREKKAFKDFVVDFFEPVEIAVSYIPMPKESFLITEKGFIVGTNNCDLNISAEIFQKLFENFQCSFQPISVIVDEYPVEIFQDKIIVKKNISKQKLKEFLSIFFQPKDVEKLVKIYSGPGTYTLWQAEDYVHFAEISFPGIGGTIIPIFKYPEERFELTWYLNGQKHVGICVTFGVGENNISCFIEDEKLFDTKIFVTPVQFVEVEKSLELGERYNLAGIFPSGLSSIDGLVGKVLILSFEPDKIVLEKISIVDSTAPQIDLVLNKLSERFYRINVDVFDHSAVKTDVFLDGEKLPFLSGLIELNSDFHLITVIAEDNFSNQNFLAKIVRRPLQPCTEHMIVFSKERVLDIGGFKFVSPYMRFWVKEDAKTRVMIDGVEKIFDEN